MSEERRQEEEYDIPLTDDFREGVETMCNLSQGIEDKGFEKGFGEGFGEGFGKGIDSGISSIIMNMYENNFDLRQISIATKKSEKEIEEIVRENGHGMSE